MLNKLTQTCSHWGHRDVWERNLAQMGKAFLEDEYELAGSGRMYFIVKFLWQYNKYI